MGKLIKQLTKHESEGSFAIVNELHIFPAAVGLYMHSWLLTMRRKKSFLESCWIFKIGQMRLMQNERAKLM